MCYSLDEIKNKAIPIARRHGVGRLCLFGSYARGEATDDSDVDFYIDDGEVSTLIKYFSFVNDLEKEFDCHVDVVSTGARDKAFIDKIESEGVLLYEAG